MPTAHRPHFRTGQITRLAYLSKFDAPNPTAAANSSTNSTPTSGNVTFTASPSPQFTEVVNPRSPAAEARPGCQRP